MWDEGIYRPAEDPLQMIRIIGVDTEAVGRREFVSDRHLIFCCELRENSYNHLISYRRTEAEDSEICIFDIRCDAESGLLTDIRGVVMSRKSKTPLHIPTQYRRGAPVIEVPASMRTKLYSDVRIYFGDTFVDIDLGHDFPAVECIVDGDTYFLLTEDHRLAAIRFAGIPDDEVEACENTFDHHSGPRLYITTDGTDGGTKIKQGR